MNSESQNYEQIHNEEEPVEVDSELSNSIESGNQIKKKKINVCKKNPEKKDDVEKIIKFIENKNQIKKQPGELDFFFASACESTKRLPRHLQLKIKGEVMKSILNAETEFLEQSSSPVCTQSLSSTSQIPIASPTRTPLILSQNQDQETSLTFSTLQNVDFLI